MFSVGSCVGEIGTPFIILLVNFKHKTMFFSEQIVNVHQKT